MTPIAVAFTGLRLCRRGIPEQHPIAEACKRWLRVQVRRIRDNAPVPVRTWVTGGALDVDTWAAEIVQAFGLHHTLAIPFEGYDNRWTAAERGRGAYIRAAASEVVVVCENPYAEPVKPSEGKAHRVSLQAYHARNHWMLRQLRPGILIGLTDGKPGGSLSTINAAKAMRPKPYLVIANPYTLDQEAN